MEEVLKRFHDRKVRYVVIGGQAVRLEGLPRFSMDWDFYIPPRDTSNLAAIHAALGDELDVDLLPLGPRGEHCVQTYQTRWGILQFHLGGPGLPAFEDAEAQAVRRTLEDGTALRCLCARHLLAAKQAANRPQDQLDIEFLKEKINTASAGNTKG